MKKTAEIKGRNIVGARIRRLREAKVPTVTIDDMVARLQLHGVTMHRSAFARIELNQRYVLDYEAKAIAAGLKVSIAELYGA